MLENIPVPEQIQVSDEVDVIVTNSVSDPGFFRIRISLFSESGSGSAKNPDPIRKNPDPNRWIKRPKAVVKEKKCYGIFHIYSSTLYSLHGPFWSGSYKTLSKPSLRSHQFINGRTRIRIRNTGCQNVKTSFRIFYLGYFYFIYFFSSFWGITAMMRFRFYRANLNAKPDPAF